MAAISLFWDTNMAAMTSCENTLLTCRLINITCNQASPLNSLDFSPPEKKKKKTEHLIAGHAVSIKHGYRTVDYRLRTTDWGLGIKHGLGIKLPTMDYVGKKLHVLIFLIFILFY